MRQIVLCEQASPTWGNSRPARSAFPHPPSDWRVRDSWLCNSQANFDLGVISESYPLDRAAVDRRAAAEQLPWSVTRVSIPRRLHNSRSADRRCSPCPRRPRPYFLREEFFSYVPVCDASITILVLVVLHHPLFPNAAYLVYQLHKATDRHSTLHI